MCSSDLVVQAVGWTGRRSPLHCTAAGRALMWQLSADEIADLLGPDPLTLGGPNCPTTGAEVMRRIDQAKRDGVAVADRELDVDVVAVACPVFSRGTVAAAVTVAGPEFRVRGHLRAVQQAVRRAAQALST